MKLVLGVDPGSRHTGYGLVAKDGSRLRLVAAGRISPKPRDALARRLLTVYQGLREIIAEHRPEVVSVEDIFFARNVRTAAVLGHVRGVALLAAAEAGLPVFEYPPATIKQSVVGYGRADKDQVGLMVRHLLGAGEGLAADASDGLAAAICHLHQSPALKGCAR